VASQTGSVIKIDGFTSDPQINETFTIAGNATEYTIQAVTNNGGGSYDLNLDQNLAATPADDAVVTIVKGYFHSVSSIYRNEIY
jgi:hypothetical protein